MSGSVGNETLQDMIEWRVASVGKANFEKEAAISGVSSADQTLGETVIPFSMVVQDLCVWQRRGEYNLAPRSLKGKSSQSTVPMEEAS